MKHIFLAALFVLSLFTISCQSQSGSVADGVINKTITVAEYEKLMTEKSNLQIVDVRTSEEYASGHLNQAKNIDYNADNFKTEIAKLDKTKPTFIYCLSGGRSGSALDEMKALGFKEVYNMQGGIMKWKSAGKNVVQVNVSKAKTGISLQEFNKMVTSNKYVLVDFNAVWCRPCKMMMPVLEKLAQEKKDKLILIKIDADENQTLCAEKKVDAIPRLELYKDGKLVWQHIGYIDEPTLLAETKL
jgi:thioredoxin